MQVTNSKRFRYLFGYAGKPLTRGQKARRILIELATLVVFVLSGLAIRYLFG